jgi:tetratricopeptide (TPR) repeat protein
MLQRLLGSRQWERALDLARDWLSQDPESAEAHLAAGQALVNLGRYAEAQTHLKKVLAARPDYGFALRLASIACCNQKQYDEADRYISRAIELQPNDAIHWYQLALIRYRQGALETAEKHARRSLELQPQNADTINLIAICQRGNPEGQYQHYLRALEINPENSTVHANLGNYYLSTARDYPAAEAAFRRALQLDPTNEFAQRNLFTVLRLRDPFYRVLTMPREFLRRISWARSGHTTMVRIGLVVVWMLMGRYFLFVLVGWLLLVWPVLKAYEYLTLSDIRAKAGEVGARRGGWFGSHRWPLMVRLGILALVIILFWGGLIGLYVEKLLPEEALYGAVVLAAVGVVGYRIGGWAKKLSGQAAAARAERKFRAKEKQQRDTY